MVHIMLSPMLRTGVSSTIAASNPSGNLRCGEASTDSAISNSINNGITSSKPVTSLKLPLQLVDESNACIDFSVGEEKAIKLTTGSTSIVVYVDWSQKLLDKYHTHYLENLPEVYKYGPVTKKARTEPLSLYTCLEAFLREEPLVPEDMW